MAKLVHKVTQMYGTNTFTLQIQNFRENNFQRKVVILSEVYKSRARSERLHHNGELISVIK